MLLYHFILLALARYIPLQSLTPIDKAEPWLVGKDNIGFEVGIRE